MQVGVGLTWPSLCSRLGTDCGLTVAVPAINDEQDTDTDENKPLLPVYALAKVGVSPRII